MDLRGGDDEPEDENEESKNEIGERLYSLEDQGTAGSRFPAPLLSRVLVCLRCTVHD
jgi:hypothetical protein